MWAKLPISVCYVVLQGAVKLLPHSRAGTPASLTCRAVDERQARGAARELGRLLGWHWKPSAQQVPSARPSAPGARQSCWQDSCATPPTWLTSGSTCVCMCPGSTHKLGVSWPHWLHWLTRTVRSFSTLLCTSTDSRPQEYVFEPGCGRGASTPHCPPFCSGVVQPGEKA